MFAVPCGHILGCVGIILYQLWSGHVPVLYWVELLFFVLCGFLLCHGWAICGHWDMRGRNLFGCYSDSLFVLSFRDLLCLSFFLKLFELFGRLLPSFFRVNFLLFLCRRLLFIRRCI